MSERKLAVLIGSSEFPKSAGALAPLRCPGRDVAALREIFLDTDRCWFHQVDVLDNQPHHEILVRINEVLRDASKEDLVLIYYSGHGKLDADSNLYLAAANTDPTLLRSTAVPIAAIRDFLVSSRCARFILILDCCYSGAAAADLQTFSEGLGASVGRYIVAASTAIQRAEEKEGEEFSVFTKHLIDGLRSGSADVDGDGLISMDELFEYVRGRMAQETLQAPMRWSFGSAGCLIMAQTEQIQTARLRRQAQLRLDTARLKDELPAPILERAEFLLSLSDQELRSQKNGTAALFHQWAAQSITTQSFIEQWYKLDSGLPAIHQPSEVQREDRWWTVRRARQPIFELIAPTYLLDSSYHFLDWNPAFDEIVAKPLGLVRGRHAEDFVLALENTREVVERAQRDFAPGSAPLVHVERLDFRSERFGLIIFDKIAAQIPSRDDHGLIWSVSLNIRSASEQSALWEAIRRRLHAEINWSKYSVFYDQMLLEFDDYRKLLAQITDLLGDAQVCADLAAGTGNGSKALLESNPQREVWAFENNEMMLERLRTKIKSELSDRLRVFKGDLTVSLHEFDENFFDGAIMVNALYAITERERCLREIFRVLKPGGVLVLSTSHRETSVTKLFTAIRSNLSSKGRLEPLRDVVEDAYDRHMAMDSDIHNDTREEVYEFVRSAGFELETTIDSAYADAVVIVRARKPLPVLAPLESPGRQAPARDQIFFSYSHADRSWLQRFQKFLAPVCQNGTLKIWDDTRIQAGDEWRAEIKEALDAAKVAVLLVSCDYLASPFIKDNELPPILDACKTAGVRIVWVPVSDCLYQHTPIERYQAAHDPAQPLDTLSPGPLHQALVAISNKIINAYKMV